MEIQQRLWEKESIAADVVFTPPNISKGIIDFLMPQGKILDPCKGDGSFYDQLPSSKMFCEITEGLDFFDFASSVDWVIGNPPYSIFEEFLRHAFEISDNVSFLVPTNKIFQRQIIMDMINDYGGIKSIIIYGSGTGIGFPFGFSVGNFHFQKKHQGDTKIIMGMKSANKLSRT